MIYLRSLGWFQFLLVQLKVNIVSSRSIFLLVSIPSGSIKSCRTPLFRSLIPVSIPSGSIKSPNPRKRKNLKQAVSIPSGSIKSN